MNIPESYLSERVGQYKRGTQMAIDAERPVGFIPDLPCYCNATYGEAHARGCVQYDPRKDSLSYLRSTHTCEACSGTGVRATESGTWGEVAGGVLIFGSLLLGVPLLLFLLAESGQL